MLAKKSSDYTRLRFEETLGDLAAYYDWDFRKDMRLNNASQPYTPAFTLTAGALYRATYKQQGSINPTVGGDKLRGMIRASQNSYLSQEEQVFTILASQADSGGISSFGASLGS